MGGDIRGGGMSIYSSNTDANPALQYGEGLVKPQPEFHQELDHQINLGTFGKIKSYDRVRLFLNLFFYFLRESFSTIDPMLLSTLLSICSTEASESPL